MKYRYYDYNFSTEPIYNESFAINYNTNMNTREKANYLVQNIRFILNNNKKLHNITNFSRSTLRQTLKKNEYDIQNDFFSYEGKGISDMMVRLHHEKKDIVLEKVDISFLCNLINDINDTFKKHLENNNHTFILATIDGKKFIIDCAYRQFFNPTLGEYDFDFKKCMAKSNENMQFAFQLLKYGWIEATPENIKTYLNAFLLSCDIKEKDLPSKELYINNLKKQTINLSGKIINSYNTRDIYKVYMKRLNPSIDDNLYKFAHIKQFNSIRTNLYCNSEKFFIVLINNKKYIRTQNGDIEYSDINLKKFLDKKLIEMAKLSNIPQNEVITPSCLQYKTIFPCGNPVLKNYNYILEDSEPHILDTKIPLDNFCSEYTDRVILNHIVCKEKRFLSKNYNLITDYLAGECEESTSRIILDCYSKGIKEAFYLFPQDFLGPGTVGHNCTIANLNGKSYLIDCTYRQFFEKSLSERCGNYMINNSIRLQVAKRLLKYGWIEATPENIKAYLDGFELGRVKSKCETNISAEEYIRRLRENEKNPINILINDYELEIKKR